MEKTSKYPIGTLVHHSIFGTGVVIGMYDEDNYYVIWAQIGATTLYKKSYIDIIVDNCKKVCEEG